MQLSEQAQSLISGEYALGLLPSTVAKRWQRLMAAQPALAEMTAQWQQQLAPMAAWIAPQPVPETLWLGIEAELFGSANTVLTLKQRPRAIGTAWFAAAALAAGLSLWLAVPSLMHSPANSALSTHAQLLATLSSDQSSAQWQVSLSDTNTLHLQINSGWSQAPSRSLELWAIDTHGKPKSLGLIALTNTEATLKLSASQKQSLLSATLLAISDEPAGGSPTALPTGPVLFTGKPTRS